MKSPIKLAHHFNNPLGLSHDGVKALRALVNSNPEAMQVFIQEYGKLITDMGTLSSAMNKSSLINGAYRPALVMIGKHDAHTSMFNTFIELMEVK